MFSFKRMLMLLGAVALGLVVLLIVGAMVRHVWKAPPTSQTNDQVVVEQPAAARPIRTHNYDVQDGAEYGYTAAITPAQQQAGQVGQTIHMMFYAGERDGRHQMHMINGNVFVVFECSAPCEVIKAMTVIDEDGLRSQVNTERIRAVPGMIAALALDDAISGRLHPYEQHINGRRYAPWVDDSKGLVRKDIGAVKLPS
jgi:hypothetical protein